MQAEQEQEQQRAGEGGAAAAPQRFDVVILGGGLAGLTLARHLLLETACRILLLERRAELPQARQKVGESTVQLAGFYYSKVLDLEEHLWRDQTMKYNLRFYWKSAGHDNGALEDYSQLYIREQSNIVSHQLDRNAFEAEVLRLNLLSDRFTLRLAVTDLEVNLAKAGAGPHRVGYRCPAGPPTRLAPAGSTGPAAPQAGETVEAGWVVDATGRGKVLARRRKLERPNPIRHGTTFLWVDGLLNIEKLTDRTPREVRADPRRSQLGHVPQWLATNHFCGEGFWFWVIPLQGKTSLGLVYDRALVDRDQVSTPEKLVAWVCREFPLFARDLPQRKILDWSGLKDYSHDCEQTISADRWAMTGEAGRFTDPLYSPGSDLISCYNTMIVDAIKTTSSQPPGDDTALAARCRLYEGLMRALYGAYVPSYAASYDTLGEREAFYLKYVWELSIYFAFYVFPFINGLLTDLDFAPRYLTRFTRLGRLNRQLQDFLSAFYQWKKRALPPADEPIAADFTEIPTLERARSTFYRVGVTADEACAVLDEQLANLVELARFVVAHVASVVLDTPEALTDAAFVDTIDLTAIHFDPDDMRRRLDAARATAATAATGATAVSTAKWSFDPLVLQRFREPRPTAPANEAREAEPTPTRERGWGRLAVTV